MRHGQPLRAITETAIVSHFERLGALGGTLLGGWSDAGGLGWPFQSIQASSYNSFVKVKFDWQLIGSMYMWK